VSVGCVDAEGVKAASGGWIDCEGKRVIFTLPVRCLQEALRAGADISAALAFWDSLWDAYNRLSPRTDPRRQRIVPDVETSLGFMHSGYPIMTHFESVVETNDGGIPYVLDVKNLKKNGSWGLFHEMGHNMQQDAWTFEGTTEVTVNLFTLWGYSVLCSDKVKEHLAPPPASFIDDGCPRAAWDSDPFLALRTYAQVLAEFGWEPLRATFQEYASEEGNIERDYARQVSDFVLRWSRACGRDLRPHWRRWGFGDVLPEGEDVEDIAALEPWTFEAASFDCAATACTEHIRRCGNNVQ